MASSLNKRGLEKADILNFDQYYIPLSFVYLFFCVLKVNLRVLCAACCAGVFVRATRGCVVRAWDCIYAVFCAACCVLVRVVDMYSVLIHV
jgi:hypothetical protein